MAFSLSSELPEIKGYLNLQPIRSQGGMSHIYRATRMDTGQEVIIKLMPVPEDAQEAQKFQRRFDQEILIARLAANDHILAAADHGDIPLPGSGEPRPYLVYPYIEHGSLADLLAFDRPWETWELPHIADSIAQAAEGLFHLHKSGIVHQDVKPNNLLWRPTDAVRNPLRRIHVWLIDFGTAEPERKGKSQNIKGTLKYLAPEQIHGEIKYSVDQYALALVARLLLTGYEPPLPHEAAPSLSTRPTQLNPRRLFEPEIDTVLLKALAPQPEARFPSVIEFAQALQYAILKQIQLHPHTTLAGASLTLFQQQHVTPPVQPAPPQQQPTAFPVQPAPFTQEEVFSPPSPPAASKDGVVLPPLTPPRPYEPPRPRERTPSAIAARNQDSRPSLPALPAQRWLTVTLPDTLRMLTWSPDGTELACTFYHDLPQILSIKHPVETLHGFAHGHSACWSPDGRFLAISMHDENHPHAEIRFCDRIAPKERQRVLAFDQPEPIRGMDWSRWGLFAIWLDHKLLVYDLSTISTKKHLPDPTYTLPLGDSMDCDQLTTLRWSPSGEWLAAGANNGQIVCWQPRTARYFQHQPIKRNIRSITWSLDSRVLIIAFANKLLLFWNLQNSQISQAVLPENPRMVSISQQTGQIAIATEKALFFFQHSSALAPTVMLPGQLVAAFSPDNKLATLGQDDGNKLILWQI